MGNKREPFITKEDFQKLYRDLTVEELETIDLKIGIVSDAIRQEAKNVGEDIDQLLESGEVYDTVLMEITSNVLSRWISQPTDFPTVDGSSDPYDSSVTWYNNSNTGVIILKRELKRLGILSQTIFTFKSVEDNR